MMISNRVRCFRNNKKFIALVLMFSTITIEYAFLKSDARSVFVERMEVLEYRQIFEVERSTFPGSTNTGTPR